MVSMAVFANHCLFSFTQQKRRLLTVKRGARRRVSSGCLQFGKWWREANTAYSTSLQMQWTGSITPSFTQLLCSCVLTTSKSSRTLELVIPSKFFMSNACQCFVTFVVFCLIVVAHIHFCCVYFCNDPHFFSLLLATPLGICSEGITKIILPFGGDRVGLKTSSTINCFQPCALVLL
jgi:hypothetical protein